eukprot:13457732-Ditylum_brightwellii.AAC.1
MAAGGVPGADCTHLRPLIPSDHNSGHLCNLPGCQQMNTGEWPVGRVNSEGVFIEAKVLEQTNKQRRHLNSISQHLKVACEQRMRPVLPSIDYHICACKSKLGKSSVWYLFWVADNQQLWLPQAQRAVRSDQLVTKGGLFQTMGRGRCGMDIYEEFQLVELEDFG